MKVGTRLYKSSSSDIKGEYVLDSKSFSYYTLHLNNKDPIVNIAYIRRVKDKGISYDLFKGIEYNSFLLLEDYNNEFFLCSSVIKRKINHDLNVINYIDCFYTPVPHYLPLSSIKYMYRRFKCLSTFTLYTSIHLHELLCPLMLLLSKHFSIHSSNPNPTSSIIKYLFSPNPLSLYMIYD